MLLNFAVNAVNTGGSFLVAEAGLAGSQGGQADSNESGVKCRAAKPAYHAARPP